jgi:hypothetical protein
MHNAIQRLQETWPDNDPVNIVSHGHSVPASSFRTPEVCTLDIYPQLLVAHLNRRFLLQSSMS